MHNFITMKQKISSIHMSAFLVRNGGFKENLICINLRKKGEMSSFLYLFFHFLCPPKKICF